MGMLKMLVAIVGIATGGLAQENQVMKAFEHYEAIRVNLAADQTKDIAKHAAALASLAESVGGAKARTAAEQLAAATDIKHAREHFGALSALLIPRFQKEELKDVHYFSCSMVNQTWAQRGAQVENPYMGKRMSTCGVPAKSSKHP